MPEAVTVNVPPAPNKRLVLFALVIVGRAGASTAVKVNACVAAGEATFVAVIVNWYVPVVTVVSMVITPEAESIVTPEGAPVSE